ncbi:Response regulator receiver domain-containing protein [Reichenbachiella faecimaris]|uniref:Response regulator receiver domain-containing protein n=1 Tax=Reichenbachiella faecimaris TaxID=692418 RepID=A0A1W2GA56_REIFA|nr:response regulator [Reichenbachiella faecimaris]SMD33176.1 Response regulator receiver domain-containing protein [Reichenbachiella faecimaris]
MEEKKKYTAVYIDDDKILLTVMTAYAQHTKYVDLLGCYLNPVEGITAIDDLKPDILFLDVQMKEIDAFDTMEALEHDPIVIIVSSHWESESELIEAGASCFLTKPLKGPNQIDQAVEKALAFRAKQKEKVKRPSIKLDSNQEILPELYKEKLTKEHFAENETWANFIVKFDQMHPSFFENLKGDFNSLTPTQMRICAYAKIGISLKNMSSNMDQALESIQTHIADIKEKLNIEPDDDLREFLSIYN